MPWTFDEYHAYPAVSRSQIVTLVQRSELYRAMYEDKTIPGEESEALSFGSHFHMRVLEPDRWKREIVVLPTLAHRARDVVERLCHAAASGQWEDRVAVQPIGFNGRTKIGKAWATEAKARGAVTISEYEASSIWSAVGGRRGPIQTITVEEHNLIEAMAASLLREPESDDETRRIVQSALAKGGREVGWRWYDKITGIECKCLHDIPVGTEWIMDLKSTGATDPESIRWAILRYKYHAQAAWYSEPLRQLGFDPKFMLVFVMKSPPHEVVAVRLDDDLMIEGREMCRRGLDELHLRRKTNSWCAAWSRRPILVGKRGLWIDEDRKDEGDEQ